MAWNSSAFRYSDDPGPLCAKDISPGFCFSSAINSGIDFTGRSGLTTRTNGDRNSNETVWKSLSVSNGNDLNRVGLAAIARSTTSMLPPGGNGTTNVIGPLG